MKRIVPLIYLLHLFGSIYGVNVTEVYENISKDVVVSPKCKQQMEEFVSNFSADINSWTLTMLDASSKIQSGLFSLNFGELGNFQQCLDIKESTKSGQIFGKYCLGSVIPFIDARIDRLITRLNVTLPPVLLTWALCVPDGCTSTDVNQLADWFLHSYIKNQVVSVKFSDVFCQTEKDTYRELTPAAVGTITLLLALVFAALFATFYDLYSRDSCPELIRVFSIPYNASKLSQVTVPRKGNISCVDGIRVLSFMWVLLYHQYLLMPAYALINASSILTWLNTRSSMFILNANFAMDTYFTIGGAMMALSFLKTEHQNGPRHFFYYIFRRYLRLAPSLVVVVLVHVTLLHHMGSGPRWPVIENYAQKYCQGYYGWLQFSFLQNYLHGPEHMCLLHAWYLNVDMQMYLFLHLALFFLWKKNQKLFFKFLYACIVLSVSSAFYIAWKYKLTAIASNFYGNVLSFQWKYMFMTHTHACSWILGFLLGHFLFQRQLNKSPLKLNKYFVIIAWFLCLVTLYTCLTIGFDTLRGPEYNRWGNVLHITFARPIWSLGIVWIILACASNYGGFINWLLSLPVFSLMNVFSYGVYLVQISFMGIIAGGRKTPEYFSDFSVYFQFLGTMCISIGLAVLLVFLVDYPVAGIVALTFRGRKIKEK